MTSLRRCADLEGMRADLEGMCADLEGMCAVGRERCGGGQCHSGYCFGKIDRRQCGCNDTLFEDRSYDQYW